MTCTRQSHQRSNTYASREDAFSTTQRIYEEQRQAFLRDELRRKRRNTWLPILTQVSSTTPELSDAKTPDDLRLSSPFVLKPSLRAPAADTRCQLMPSPRCKQRYSTRSADFYKDGLDTLLAKCKETERLPDISKRVTQERKILKKYSQRMNWTLDTLLQNNDLEYKVLSPLFQFLAQQQAEVDDCARDTANAVRHGRTIQFSRRLQPKRKPRKQALLE